MRNLQNNLNIIWQPSISRQPPPPVLSNLPFSSKHFQTPPFPSILKKSNPPPFMKEWQGGGCQTMLVEQLLMAVPIELMVMQSSWIFFSAINCMLCLQYNQIGFELLSNQKSDINEKLFNAEVECTSIYIYTFMCTIPSRLF